MKFQKISKSLFLGATFAAFTLGAVGANAAAILSFDDDAQNPTGTVSYSGDEVGGDVLIGSGIGIVSIQGFGTPDNDGNQLNCVGCTLSFETGAVISEGPDTWQFGAGGFFRIEGVANNTGGELKANGILLEGRFTSEVSVTSVSIPGLLDGLIVAGFGLDTKNEDLLDFYGLTDNTSFVFANTNISMAGVELEGDGGFSGTVTNVDLDNTEIPLPAAAWLFGSGLIGLAGITRRKKAA